MKNILKSVKGAASKVFGSRKPDGRTIKTPSDGDGLRELQLDQKQDTLRLQEKDREANSVKGRIKGYLTLKSKDRYKDAIHNAKQKEKDIEVAIKDKSRDKAKRGVAYTAAATGVGSSAYMAKNVHDQKSENEKVLRRQEAVNRRVSRANLTMNKIVSNMQKTASVFSSSIEENDKTASTALKRAIIGAVQKGNMLKASKIYSKAIGGTKGMSGADVKDAVHGLSVNSSKGGTLLRSKKGAPNYAKNKDGNSTSINGLVGSNLIRMQNKTRKVSGRFKNLPKSSTSPIKPTGNVATNALNAKYVNNTIYKKQLKLKEM